MAKRKSKQTKKEIEIPDDEYQVEEILASKLINGKIYYLIKWVGYDRSHCTWENSSHVFCDELIEQYKEILNKSSDQLKSIEKEFPFPEEYLDESLASGEEVEEEEEEEVQKNKKQKKSTTKQSKKKESPPKETAKKETAKKEPTKKETAKKETAKKSTPVKPEENKKKDSTPIKDEKKQAAKPSPSNNKSQPTVSLPYINEQEAGFEHGDTVESILGCKMLDELSFYVKWNGKDSFTYVPNQILREREPQKLLDFYQSRIQFEKRVLN